MTFENIYQPALPRPPVSAYTAEAGNIPLVSSLDFFRERQELREYMVSVYDCAITSAVTRCNTLQHAATRCNTVCCIASSLVVLVCSLDLHCNILQHTAAHCNTLQHTATHCNTLANDYRPYLSPQCTAHEYCLHLSSPPPSLPPAHQPTPRGR